MSAETEKHKQAWKKFQDKMTFLKKRKIDDIASSLKNRGKTEEALEVEKIFEEDKRKVACFFGRKKCTKSLVVSLA